MKTIVFFLGIVAVASAQFGQLLNVGTSLSSVTGRIAGVGVAKPASVGISLTPQVTGVGQAAGGMSSLFTPIYYGPKVFGAGANSLFAQSPDPFVMQRALTFVNMFPDRLIRLDADGAVIITDQYGLEVEPMDNFGREIKI